MLEGPDKKHIRVLFFIALGATSFLPQMHFLALYGVDHYLAIVDVIWLFAVSVPLYLIGSVVFVFKFPERFFPGRFDIWFHSHQLWHIFVILAAYAHYLCMYNMMHARQELGCTMENEYALLADQQMQLDAGATS
ncbi:hypothetical protein PTSG_10536 [Salpingoeca rosetta]|uniref:Uncharacterized protein n=1 Tax=Salpingoeca rosetta (strain ATCC 50818 / BSB-021) TaxID=946362 RepID=F2URM6_SALR5|nr:uncharacterized protein PTSG_10536 [Salpingoeca rosetta]EGD80281.1 hypothetical protein PTSG_10536 [Salpingoeca rosetta]|eukprot:XP_004988071.1 hypothetical protein PTSG_10536 [Salpingoeca rosetta]